MEQYKSQKKAHVMKSWRVYKVDSKTKLSKRYMEEKKEKKIRKEKK